jgi:hypothetical protein
VIRCIKSHAEWTKANREKINQLKGEFEEIQQREKVLGRFVNVIETAIKRLQFMNLQSMVLPVAEISAKFSSLFFVSHLQKIFIKQKAQIFTLLLRECMSKQMAKFALKNVNAMLTQHLSRHINIMNVKSPKFHNKYYILMKFGLIFQSIFEKIRTNSLFKGFCAFKFQSRSYSCLTPTLILNRSDKTCADSLDKNLTSPFFSKDSYTNSTTDSRDRRKFCLGIPDKAMAKATLEQKLAKPTSHTDRRRSMNLIRNPKFLKVDSTKSYDLRKAYDLKLKSTKEEKKASKSKRSTKPPTRENARKRTQQLMRSMVHLEEKFRLIVKKHTLLTLNSILMAMPKSSVKLEAWKLNIYMLALHKFAFTVKLKMKAHFNSLRFII